MDDVFIGIVLIPLFIILAIATPVLTIKTIIEPTDITYEEVERPIYSLRTAQAAEGNLHGNFVMGVGTASGRLKSGIKYYVYEDAEDGKVLRSFDAEKTYINEINDTPYAKYIYKVKHYKHGEPVKSIEKVILNVPNGTLKEEYDTVI